MGTPCLIDVKLSTAEGRKPATIKIRNGGSYKAPVFMVSKLYSQPEIDILDSDLTLCVVAGRRGREGTSVHQPKAGEEAGSSGYQSGTGRRDREPVRQQVELYIFVAGA